MSESKHEGLLSYPWRTSFTNKMSDGEAKGDPEGGWGKNNYYKYPKKHLKLKSWKWL